MTQNNWNNINWREVRKIIEDLQMKIYNKSKKSDIAEMHKIQNLLINSFAGKLLAVRRVTMDSTGKKTPGLDNKLALTPRARWHLANNLALDGQSEAVKRIWIPKPGTTDKRPLGIPTIQDRAKQALAKLVLEPEWEAKFEENSYGFRPGRRAHDAIKAIKNSLVHGQKYILDADIEKCFDNINHEALLNKLSQPKGSIIYNQVSAWLKSGFMEKYGSPFYSTELGTPQGGVISPLLANIALHGLEQAVLDAVGKLPNKVKMQQQTKVIRYADDFLILTPFKDRFDAAKLATIEFLETVGLNLKAAKTRELHSLDKKLCPDGNNSFDFLGFTICQRPVGKRSMTKASGGRKIPWKVVILPSRKKVDLHFASIRSILKKCTKPDEIIRKLNPIIRGWCNYFKVSDFNTYGGVASSSRRLYLLLSNWQKRRYHTRKRISQLWKTVGTNNWTFATTVKKKEYTLIGYGCVSWSVNDYIKVSGNRSPFDGDHAYWLARTSHTKQSLVMKLYKRQKGLCQYCGQTINALDLYQIDHIIPRAQNGSEKIQNLQLLHKECHAKKTKLDRSTKAKDAE